MTNQEIVNFVAAKLRKQGKRSMTSDAVECVTCAYRGPDGSKCAVGWLIPDELYARHMEYETPDSLKLDVNCKSALEEALKQAGCTDTAFLYWLQRAHDRAENPHKFLEDFNNNLRSLCARYDLVYPAE